MSWDRGIISTYTNGVDLVFEWKIDNFFNLPERDSGWYYCPEFSFGGEIWCLEIYPHGSSGRDSFGHVDLGLSKMPSDRSIKQSFSLSLKTAEVGKYNEQHFLKDFDNDNWIHRFNRLIPRSELSRRRSELMPKGVLTVIGTMKSSTSAGSDSNVASSSAECCHCKGTFKADSLTLHQKKCQHPDCLEVVVLQKWFDEHKCQQERPEEGNDLEHAAVEASTHRVEVSTQTVEACIQSVEASILTVEESTQTVEEKCEACASRSSTNPQEKKVLHDLKELFLNKEDCDVTIKVKGSEFPAHRLILKARSPVFASTFRHDMKENTTGVLEIQDCDSSIFSDFLCFLYYGDVGMISLENVFGLFTAADKYQVLDFRAKCFEFMKMNITVDTFCETITLALRHSETELIRLCTDYFKRNVPKIIVTVKWQTFLAENPTESNELLVKFFCP